MIDIDGWRRGATIERDIFIYFSILFCQGNDWSDPDLYRVLCVLSDRKTVYSIVSWREGRSTAAGAPELHHTWIQTSDKTEKITS